MRVRAVVGGMRCERVVRSVRSERIVSRVGSEGIMNSAGSKRIMNSAGSKRIINRARAERIVDGARGKRIVDRTRGKRVVDRTRGKRVVDRTRGERVVDRTRGERVVDRTRGERVVDGARGERIMDRTGGEVIVRGAGSERVVGGMRSKRVVGGMRGQRVGGQGIRSQRIRVRVRHVRGVGCGRGRRVERRRGSVDVDRMGVVRYGRRRWRRSRDHEALRPAPVLVAHVAATGSSSDSEHVLPPADPIHVLLLIIFGILLSVAVIDVDGSKPPDKAVVRLLLLAPVVLLAFLAILEPAEHPIIVACWGGRNACRSGRNLWPHITRGRHHVETEPVTLRLVHGRPQVL
jgi:hypothetical protein